MYKCLQAPAGQESSFCSNVVGCCFLGFFFFFAGFGFQLGWEGELDRADAGTRKRAFNNQEWSPPSSPGEFQNGDQTLAVSRQDCCLCGFLGALSVRPSRSLSRSWLINGGS